MIDVKEVNMKELLDEVSIGAMVIPDFQRDFIWKKKQIEELLNSVINNYFIGPILLLESSPDNLRFAPRLIHGANPKQVTSTRPTTIKYILDGQQRITSLFYAFCEPNVFLSDDVGIVCKFYLWPETMDVYGLEDPEDIARKLRLSVETKNKLLEVYNQFFGIDIKNVPTMGVFRNNATLDQYVDKNPQLKPSFKEKMELLFKKIDSFKIAIITLSNDTSDDEIVNTFERINRTGTRLGIFELAVAKYYPMGIKLNTLKDGVRKEAFIEILDDESILKVMALFKGLDPKPQNLIKLTDPNKGNSENQAGFYSLWERAVEYLKMALVRIRTVYGAPMIRIGKRNLDLIPYTSLIVPLASLLYEIDTRGRTKHLFDKLDLWYWTSVFTQRYTHAVDSKSFTDMQTIRNWFDNDETKPDFNCNFDHIKSEMLKAARSSALAKGFYNILSLNGCKDLMTGQDVKLNECHIDHLFPSAKFKGVDCIFNLTILDKNTNQAKKDKLPSEFVTECLGSHGNNADKVMRTLKSHFICEKAYNALKANNVSDFIQARAENFITALRDRVVS